MSDDKRKDLEGYEEENSNGEEVKLQGDNSMSDHIKVPSLNFSFLSDHKVISPLNQLQDDIKESQRAFHNLHMAISSQAVSNPIKEQIRIVQEERGKVFERISADISADLKTLVDSSKQSRDDMSFFEIILLEADFPPHPEIPIHIMREVLHLYNNKGIAYTKRLIERYMTLFAYKKSVMMDIRMTWQKAEWLGYRQKILDTVIEGHLYGYYELTVPTILSQLEGVLVDAMLLLGYVKIGENVTFPKQEAFLKKIFMQDEGTLPFKEKVLEFYVGTILANFNRGGEVLSELSRHAILHGEDLRYGTKVNSLKAILVFDMIVERLEELYEDIESSKVMLRGSEK